VRWIAGDFAAAVALAQEAVAWQPRATARRRAVGPAVGALAAIECGDGVEAERLMTRANETYGGRDWSFFLQVTRAAEGLFAWQAGRAADCVAMLRPATASLMRMQSRPWAAFFLIDLAEAAAEAGDAAVATAAAADLDGVAEFIGLPLYCGLAAAASAWAGLAGGDGERAGVCARRAIELLSSTGCAAYLGRAHHVLGRVLPADARPEAVAALERAAAILGECGSSWRRQRSLDALRRLGSAGRRAAAAALGPGSLTRREHQVARLAATGMSAKEIAGTLFVGERTVESHLASVYAKLGVDSKLQLVRRAAELGLS
jgi:DNA-binding CsgD family transcriptional regulator